MTNLFSGHDERFFPSGTFRRPHDFAVIDQLHLLSPCPNRTKKKVPLMFIRGTSIHNDKIVLENQNRLVVIYKKQRQIK